MASGWVGFRGEEVSEKSREKKVIKDVNRGKQADALSLLLGEEMMAVFFFFFFFFFL